MLRDEQHYSKGLGMSLSKQLYKVVETDQRTAQVQERLMDVVPPLVADREPAVLRKPGQCPLHHPPVSSQLLGALSMPFLAIRLFMPRLRKAPLHFLSS